MLHGKGEAMRRINSAAIFIGLLALAVLAVAPVAHAQNDGECVYICPFPGYCYWDCYSGGEGYCGDNYCDVDMGEDYYSCSIDCGCATYAECLCPGAGRCVTVCVEVIIGDGVCAEGEDEWNSPNDCPPNICCGDGYCYYDESVATCAVDCGFCGDGYCDSLEDFGSCPYDCEVSWDADGDLIPDDYEDVHAGDVPALDSSSNGDAAADFDLDGNPNLHEYWNGTDPWSVDPVPPDGKNPACYYLADGDGDGVAGPGDMAMLGLEIAGMPQNYSRVLPPVFEGLDLDKDGSPGPGDKPLLESMIARGERATAYPSAPASLSVVFEPAGPVEAGSTTHVTVAVKNASGSVTTSGGFAVVFWIDPAYARNGTLLGGEGTDPNSPQPNRYDISGPSSQGGLATIVVRVEKPGLIPILARVPACGSPSKGRWIDAVDLPSAVVITGE